MSDQSLNEFVSSLDDAAKTSLTAGEAMKQLSTEVIQVEQKVNLASTAFNTLKSFGKAAISGAFNAATVYIFIAALQKVAEVIYDIIHADEIAIEKGNAAREAIKDINSSYESTESTVNDLKERYSELTGGVDHNTNTNLSLSTDEYKEFLNINNQLADIFPEIVVGYDAQGNALTSLSGVAGEATEQLSNLLQQEKDIANYKIADQLQNVFNGIVVQERQYQEELNDLYAQRDRLEASKREVEAANQSNVNENNTAFKAVGDAYFDDVSKNTYQSYSQKVRTDLSGYNERLQAMQAAAKEAGIEFSVDMASVADGFNVEVWNLLDATDDQMNNFYEAYSRNLKGITSEYSQEVSAELNEIYSDINIDEREVAALWKSFSSSLISSMNLYDGYEELDDNIKQLVNNAINGIGDRLDELTDEDRGNIRQYARKTILDPILDMDGELRTAFDKIIGIYEDSSMSISEKEIQIKATLAGSGDSHYLSSILKTLGLSSGYGNYDVTGGKLDEILSRENNTLTKSELSTLNDNQFTIAYDLIVNKGEAFETLDLLLEKINEIQNVKIESEPITFSSLFTDSSGEQSEFSKSVDTFQEDISSIQESLDTLKEGENISFIDLVQQFPQLSGEADNLSEALNNLKLEKLQSFSETWKTAVTDLDADELKVANQYLRELLSTLDMSDTDISFGDISSRLLSDATATLERADISNVLNKVWLEYGDTAEGRALIAKLSLETDAATWTFEEWVANIEDTKIKADLQLSEESIADLQKQLEMKQSEASVTQSEIDLKNAAGYRTTEEDYKTLIKNGKEQITIQNDIIKKRKKEQDNIKKVAQSTEQATAKYNELQKEIDSATSTLNDAYKSQIEWNTALDNLPITNAQSLSSAISNAMSEIDSSTGLTVDTVAALKEQFSELTNIDIEDALYRTADGLKIDTNELERFTEAQNDAVMSQFESKIEAQRKAIEVYKTTIGDNTTDSKLIKMQDDLESLLNRQAQYFAEYKNQMEQFTDYEDVQRAKNTENAGSHYDTMLSDLKTAKESYDKGLIGTDDFKSVAKYISPNGFDDFTNFAENYSKASRYLTEDSSGVINFLNDLQAKGYAAYQTLDDGSDQWIINIQDFADAAKDIGIGTDFFTDMFGKLEDYNIPNTFVSSVTEGELKIDDLTKQLVDAKVKLVELKAEGADTAIIDSQQRVVDELSTNLTNTQQSMNMFVESTKQNYVEGFSQVKDVISQLNDFRKNAQSEEEAQGYLSKIQEYADKYHLKLTADFEVDEASYQEQMDKMYIKSGSFENPIDPGFEKGSADAENYRSVVESVTKAHSENNKVLDESIKTLSKYDTETLKGINLNDGQYSVGLEDAERALDSLAQELGLTEEQAQMLATVLGSLGQTKGEVNVDYVDVTEAINNLEEMQKLGEIDETIDFAVDLSELDSSELESYLEKLKKIKLAPDTEEYDYVVQRIQDTEIQMIIKETLENGSTVEELLSMSDEDLAKTCNINLNDDGASERLEAIKENLQEVNNGADVPMTIRMDDTQFNQLLSDKNNDTATITVDADNEPAKEKIDEVKGYADDQTGTMNIDGTKTLAINEANTAVNEINAKTATISIDGNLYLLSEKLTQELSKTRTINVSARVSGLPKAGEALGTAHARGTAVLDMWNGYRHSIGAYANGTAQNWALPHNEEALVNETGEPESIVRDGRWFLIPGGAHVEQLKKGDIIFNHKYKL